MRTLFEDTDERANREDAREKANPRLPLYLWIVAVTFLASSWSLYYWASHRKPPEPPPAVASLDDEAQISQTINRFNGFVKDGNWDQATRMLSADALKQVEREQRTLPESLLSERKDDKVIEALITPSRARTPSTVRVDCAYLFSDNQNKVIPLTIILENDRLAIDSW